MNTKVTEILDYMEGGEKILQLRDQAKVLDARNDAALQETMDHFQSLISQDDPQDQEYLGYYHLFLGCAYYERGEYVQATKSLKRSLPKLRASKNNKAVGRWLLSVAYASAGEYDKARRELVRADKLSNAHADALQKKINEKIREMFNDPIFDEVPPNPRKAKVNASQDSMSETQPARLDSNVEAAGNQNESIPAVHE